MAKPRATEAAKDRIQSIFRATLPEIYGYLLACTGQNHALADDIASETYIHAARLVAQGRGDEVTVAWLKTVAKRRLIDSWRREERIRWKAQRLATLNPTHQTGDPAEIDDALRQEVFRVLGLLTAEQRAVLVMKYLDEQSVAEIAEVLGRSEKAVESLLHRARGRFRDLSSNEFGRQS